MGNGNLLLNESVYSSTPESILEEILNRGPFNFKETVPITVNSSSKIVTNSFFEEKTMMNLFRYAKTLV
jgi:hypothetical protein